MSKQPAKGILIEVDFQTYSATLLGSTIFFHDPGSVPHIIMSSIYYFFLWIEEQTEIAPRRAKCTKNEKAKAVCHSFFFKAAVSFHVYNFFSSLFQIPKVDW